jgi:hypothetical protein
MVTAAATPSTTGTPALPDLLVQAGHAAAAQHNHLGFVLVTACICLADDCFNGTLRFPRVPARPCRWPGLKRSVHPGRPV